MAYDYTSVDPTSKVNPGGYGTYLKDVIEPEKAETENYLTRFKNFISALEPVQNIAARLESEAGIPKLKETYLGMAQAAGGLANTLMNLPYMVQAETKGRPVTQSQQDRMLAARSAEPQKQLSNLSSQLGTMGTNISALSSDVTQKLGYELDTQKYGFLPFQTEATFLADRSARAATGWTNTMEMKLNEYISRIGIEGGLQMEDLQQAGRLALAEKQFEYNKQLKELELSNKGSNFDWGAYGLA